jgi:hypothetical protein
MHKKLFVQGRLSLSDSFCVPYALAGNDSNAMHEETRRGPSGLHRYASPKDWWPEASRSKIVRGGGAVSLRVAERLCIEGVVADCRR